MHLGTLIIHLHIPQSQSLKAKRHVINAIKDRLRNKFNISVAEVGANDLWQRCELGIAMVANDQRFVNSVLDQVENFVASRPEVVITDSERTFY